jgi:zinc protease
MPIRQARRTLLLLALTAPAARAAHVPVAPHTPPVRPASPAAVPGAVESYLVDSVRVLQRVVPGSPVVAARILLLGGVRQLDAATQGIEELYLMASEYGTRAHPDSDWRLAWRNTGSHAIAGAGDDWSTIGFDGLASDFEASWSLITDRMLAPTLSSTAVTRARDRQLAWLRRARATPDAEIRRLADSVAYRGSLYGLATQGTDASLAALDSAALRDHATRSFVQSRLLVVVVGDVPRARVEAAVRGTLARLPRGRYTWSVPRPPRFERSSVTFLPQRLATNYIVGVFPAPPADGGELLAFRWAVGLLGSMIDEEVRQKRGLSYAATASVNDRAAPQGYFYMTTNRPKEALQQVRTTIVRLREAMELDEDLRLGGRRRESLGFLFGRMTASSQVDALVEAQLLLGDHRLADRDLATWRSVSGQAVRMAIMRYVRNVQFVYAGDTTQVARSEFEKF